MNMPTCAGRRRYRRAEKHRDHAADAVAFLVSTDRDEVHALRKANDLCHAGHLDLALHRERTMKAASFQGAP